MSLMKLSTATLTGRFARNAIVGVKRFLDRKPPSFVA
jgi:hypothetical protein